MATIFCISCLWKYGFALLDFLYGSVARCSGKLAQHLCENGVQFPAAACLFTAGILLLLFFDKLKSHFGVIACIAAVLYLFDHFITKESLIFSGFRGGIRLWVLALFGNFAKFGDFSYGVYIVHWPIIQTVILLGHGRLSPPMFLLLNLTLVP